MRMVHLPQQNGACCTAADVSNNFIRLCAGMAGATGQAGTPLGTTTPVQPLKRATPASGNSLSGILASGPQFRVSGLRRAGGIKLHNVGPGQTPR